MSRVCPGPVFAVGEMTDAQRARTAAEWAWLEKDLVRRRAKLRYWTFRQHQPETLPGIPDDLRQETRFFYDQAVRLVAAGDTLRAYPMTEIHSQPQYAAAYHHRH